MKINWPTAAVLCVFIAAWALLAIFHVPVPIWMAAAGAIVGKIVMAILPSLTGAGSNGNGSGGGSADAPATGSMKLGDTAPAIPAA